MEGYEVTHVMNVTDVGHLTSDADEGEDKMEKGAAREGKSVWEIADMYWSAFKQDMRRLNLSEPDVWCKATDHIPEQIALVKTLEKKGYTYVIADGVYMDTSKIPDYGKLARLDIKGLKAGVRVEMAEGKRNLTDFALWKFSPAGSKRLMEWPSPWGVGFPGWHVECSAMAVKYLGERVDIHCGGVDHVAVHHTNEIAQAECALGHEWVRWWMHGEFLTMAKSADGDGAKMSKSSGDFLTLDRLMERGVDPLAYRYFCLNAHYRQQLAFTWPSLEAAGSALARLKETVIELRKSAAANAAPLAAPLAQFRAAIEDDLNMPRATAALWTMLSSGADKGAMYATLLEMDKVLGLGLADVREEAAGADEPRIDELIAARNAARKAKDFAGADAIRKQLAEMGIELKDTPTGTTWRKS
jgi:cysteinyl-tRNA synthetase